MENGSLMKVESITEREHSAILLTCIKQKLVLKTIFFCIFRVVVLDRFYCKAIYNVSHRMKKIFIWTYDMFY